MTDLKARLLSDLTLINLPIDEVDFHIRPYSSTYYGRYFPVHDEHKKVRPKIYLYPYENTDGDLMNYDYIIETGIHEMCHHIQYTSSTFIRNKGVMHDTQFWRLYNHYVNRAKRLNILKGGADNEVLN